MGTAVTKGPRIVLITGVSGSGKSTATETLEDLGFFCVDNLPVGLLETFVSMLERSVEIEKVALVMDLREREFPEAFPAVLESVEKAGLRLEVLFFDASDEVLVRRFSETRRKHPLGLHTSLEAAISSERKLLRGVRDRATTVLDTTELNVHQLKKRLKDEFSLNEGPSGEMTIRVVSFGFGFGVPHAVDMVLDVRFLPNPHFMPGLREKDGRDLEVSQKVLDSSDGKDFVEQVEGLLKFLLPRYRNEGKSYLTIGFGCTGGKHRSVAVSEHVGSRLRDLGYVVHVEHRELNGA